MRNFVLFLLGFFTLTAQGQAIRDGAIVSRMMADSTYELEQKMNVGLAASVNANALTVALKQADGSTDCTALKPCVVTFRSSTVTSGGYTKVRVTGALSLTVSSGSTLGTRNGIGHHLTVYLINNAGTAELAISNGRPAPVEEIVSTTAEGGAGAADSAGVLYSTTARSNVAFIPIGTVTSTQATAGTWATTPSHVAAKAHEIKEFTYNLLCSSSASIIAYSRPGFISSIANISSNRCAITFASGVCTDWPMCTANIATNATGTLDIANFTMSSLTAGSIGGMRQNGSTTSNLTNNTYFVKCACSFF